MGVVFMRYVIVLHKDVGSDFGVTVPDLQGCFSAGETIEAAIENATEAIECHLEAMVHDGEQIPAAKPIEFHRKNPDYFDGIWAITQVNVDTSMSKIAA